MEFLKRFRTPEPQLPRYVDMFDTMRYLPPEDAPAGVLPTIYAFRVKEGVPSPDPRPSFVLLETDEEVDSWHKAMAGKVVLNEDGHFTDEPLLRWNTIPSVLTSDDEVIATYLPAKDGENWPPLAVQAHPFGAELGVKPARDRYYFEQNKIIAVL